MNETTATYAARIARGQRLDALRREARKRRERAQQLQRDAEWAWGGGEVTPELPASTSATDKQAG